MKARRTLFLAAVFILLAAYLYLFEFQKEAKTERLLSFRETEVESIVLSNPHQEIRLRREASGSWKMTSPVEAAADPSAIRSLLSALSASEVIRIVEKKPSAADLRAFGLDQPEIRVLITLEQGKALPALLIGARTPLGNSTYVQRENELGVLLTSAALSLSLEKKAEDFRANETPPAPQDKAAEQKKSEK